jgi:hypothetical protein
MDRCRQGFQLFVGPRFAKAQWKENNPALAANAAKANCETGGKKSNLGLSVLGQCATEG